MFHTCVRDDVSHVIYVAIYNNFILQVYVKKKKKT